MKNILFKILIFSSLIASTYAYEPYHAVVAVGVEHATVSAPNLVDLNRNLKSSSIQALIPFYTPASPLFIGINLRGIGITASFAANSTTLNVTIPQAGIAQSFTGSTRDQSLSLLRDYIRNGGTRHNLLKAYARFSPIDPIAGNPNSLLYQMGQADYLLGRLNPLSGCECGFSAQPIVHQFQIGTFVTRAFTRRFDTTLVTLPLRYSYSPDLNWAFIIDAPLTYLRNGGASSVVGSVGFGLRVPLTEEWSLTPILRAGSGGTLDLCTSGTFATAGVASEYQYKFYDFVFAMTNYAGYSSSVNLWLTGVNFNYNLHNYVFKNGLSINTCNCFNICNRPVNFLVNFVDTYYSREHLYIRHYDEVGGSLILNNLNPHLTYDLLSLTFSYQFGQKNYKGYSFGMTYLF